MPNISDEIGEKSVVLAIKAIKLDAELLKKAIKAIMKGGDNLVKKITTPENMNGKGKQTVKQLARQGQGVSNIEITDKNIKSFERVARKYGVDFALKKDNTETPPKWLVFFKGKDADALTAAFKEFTAKEAKRNVGKPSVLKMLGEFAEKVKNQVIDVVKNKTRGGHTL